MEKRSRYMDLSEETMNKRSRKTPKTGAFLPKEIVEEEILWRLPVKSIIRMSSVCKSWYSLIRTRNFISKTRKAPLVFLRNYPADRHNPAQLSFILENHNHPFHIHHLDHRVLRLPTTDPLVKFNVLGGSCNGVFCLFGIRNNFILCNPSISRSLTLPIPQLVPFSMPTQHLLGFGFDDEEEDYKIVRIVASNSNTNWAAEVYSLNLNYWWPLPPIYGVPEFDFVKNNTRGAFVKGRLHWIVSKITGCNFILVFDVNLETFHHIPFPKCLEGSNCEQLRVLAFQESSIVLVQQPDPDQRVVPAWIMEEYEEESSWKTTTIDHLLDSRLVGSSITNERNFLYVAQAFGGCPLPYVPSLVLLDKQNS